MYNSDLYKRIKSEVDMIKLIDTHEHLSHPYQLQEMGKIDFGRLFSHYASADLVSAGMPPVDMGQVQNCSSPLTPGEKWKLIEPYYRKTWNTGYCECIRITMRNIYGIDDLRGDTVDLLSQKMNDVPRDTWTRDLFDKAGIDVALEHSFVNSHVYPRKYYPDIFVYDMCDEFSHFNIHGLSADTGIYVTGLGDYLKIIDWYFDKFADEASAFKISRAYDRTLFFDDVTEADASRIFSRLLQFNNNPGRQEMQALEDFIIHYCIRKSGEYGLTVKFHTGLQEGNGNVIMNSRAALLTNLFMKYPKTKFDMYHLSWPYTEELINVCKNFPNVFIDFCWAWIFNPPASRRYLSDMLETVPLSKIHGFGGDFIFAEGSYGHSVIARREIARVLSEKVGEGRFTEEFAVIAAQRMLRENAIENFGLEPKRQLIQERSKQQ
ncbi:MAG: amidohydrolase family protein [Armatimonadota bacterium]